MDFEKFFMGEILGRGLCGGYVGALSAYNRPEELSRPVGMRRGSP